MSESIGPISSAVIAPEPSAQSPPRKRRQSILSNTSHTSPKRARLSHDENTDSPSTLSGSPTAGTSKPEPAKVPQNEKDKELAAARRKSSVQEERKRSQRLFGGLLSTLGQGAPSGQQKRKQEVEKRQAERVRQKKDEDEVQKADRLAKLKAARKVESVKYNKESMRIRHSNLLSRAYFLNTKTEPKLYYKPWKLLADEEDRIKQQISEVEALIERELDGFNNLHPEEPSKEAPVPEENTDNSSRETVGEPHIESPLLTNADVDPTNSPVPSPQPATGKPSLEEHNGEVVVEADEDTVIY